MNRPSLLATVAALLLCGMAASAPAQESQRQKGGPGAAARPTDASSGFDIEKYFSEMMDDVAVYDPASPFIYDKDQWRRRVDQMFKIRRFLDLNTFHKTEVEIGDMKIVTVYREIRRPEGSFTERLHGRITWVWLKQPDGRWFLWHDHTSEIPEDSQYSK
jgi:ketosteroid isomerase-like protein